MYGLPGIDILVLLIPIYKNSVSVMFVSLAISTSLPTAIDILYLNYTPVYPSDTELRQPSPVRPTWGDQVWADESRPFQESPSLWANLPKRAIGRSPPPAKNHPPPPRPGARRAETFLVFLLFSSLLLTFSRSTPPRLDASSAFAAGFSRNRSLSTRHRFCLLGSSSRSVYLPPVGLRTADIPGGPAQSYILPSFSPTRLDPTPPSIHLHSQHCQGMRSNADRRRSRRKSN